MKLPVKILITVLVTLLCASLMAYSILGVILLGPSKDAGRMLLTSLNESGMSFVPRLYMNEDRIEELLNSYDNGEVHDIKTVTITTSHN